MIGQAFERTVTVWNESCSVTAYHQSKTVWVAVGDYMGERVETKGSSLNSALSHWRESARYKGNG